jgi:hypothetical protein
MRPVAVAAAVLFIQGLDALPDELSAFDQVLDDVLSR